MKRFKYILSTALAIMFFTSACINDLDIVPIDPLLTTSATVYDSPAAFKEGLAKLYGSFAVSGQRGPAGLPDIAGIDEGFSNYLRQYWNLQELSTDEAVVAWNDQTIKDFNWHSWTSLDPFIGAMFSRIMYTVAISNEFIRQSANNESSEVQLYHEEARFIRALAYYHGLDMFGKMPFVTEANLPGSFAPEQIIRTDLFNYLEQELLDLENKLGEPKFMYARADKAAAWMLLTKLYLNAEVYTGTAKWSEAAIYAEKVINGPFSLATNYRQNFVADNHISPEMIFPITFDGLRTQTYGGTTYLINASIGGDMPGSEFFGVTGRWGGLRTTSAFLDRFEDISGNTDTRALFWTQGQSRTINDIAVFTDGIAVTKFRNRKLDGSPADNAHPEFPSTDFPVFRLADAYLMYAEAVRRGGAGNQQLATNLINQLRTRAMGSSATALSWGDITLQYLIDERGRELYWEGHRRTDLIRFGLFSGGSYVWDWKGNVKEGAASEPFRDLFPIPSADRAINPNLTQNQGYN
ncbi:MAG: RagB/SusD family nutrient uptake outer membrane protein [Cyclobacteriaceae bacterium]|nr:RagB/SusD family nutrient uptake outer membrane protein [Cyclobacteriaceae bacterium]